MFLSGSFGQWLEPVGDMGHTMFHGPFFHPVGDAVCRRTVKALAAFDTIQQRMKGIGIQIFAHLPAVEYQFTEIRRGLLIGDLGRNDLFFEGFLHQIKSVHDYCCFK